MLINNLTTWNVNGESVHLIALIWLLINNQNLIYVIDN